MDDLLTALIAERNAGEWWTRRTREHLALGEATPAHRHKAPAATAAQETTETENTVTTGNARR